MTQIYPDTSWGRTKLTAMRGEHFGTAPSGLAMAEVSFHLQSTHWPCSGRHHKTALCFILRSVHQIPDKSIAITLHCVCVAATQCQSELRWRRQLKAIFIAQKRKVTPHLCMVCVVDLHCFESFIFSLSPGKLSMRWIFGDLFVCLCRIQGFRLKEMIWSSVWATSAPVLAFWLAHAAGLAPRTQCPRALRSVHCITSHHCIFVLCFSKEFHNPVLHLCVVEQTFR